jgi:hypothetical protein
MINMLYSLQKILQRNRLCWSCLGGALMIIKFKVISTLFIGL